MQRSALLLTLALIMSPQALPAQARQLSNPFRPAQPRSTTAIQGQGDRSSDQSNQNPFRTTTLDQPSTYRTMEFRTQNGSIVIGGFAGRIADSPRSDLSSTTTNIPGTDDWPPSNSQQSANQWQTTQRPTYSSRQADHYSNAPKPPRTQSNAQQPAYAKTIEQTSSAKRHAGVDYDTNAGIGFDQRTEKWVGGRYDSQDGGIVGGGGSVGAGLYADAGASQSGKIGDVEIRNYATAEGFVGTEAGAKAGLTKNGVELGANGFAGGRASGTVGSDIGPVGYGATGEAWSGVGLEVGVKGGFKDGKLKFGAEAGGALGVGGKLGVQAEVDIEKIGNGVKKAGRNVGNAAKKAGQNVGNTAKKAGQNVGNTAKKAGQNVGNAANKAGKGIGDTAKKVGKGTKKFFDKFKK